MAKKLPKMHKIGPFSVYEIAPTSIQKSNKSFGFQRFCLKFSKSAPDKYIFDHDLFDRFLTTPPLGC